MQMMALSLCERAQTTKYGAKWDFGQVGDPLKKESFFWCRYFFLKK
jgi:hypothetical protein